MDLDTAKTELEHSLGDAANRWDAEGIDDAMERLLKVAAADMHRRRPLMATDTLTLVADQPNYPCPDGLLVVNGTDWADKERHQYPQWDPRYPGPAPLIRVRRNGTSREIWLSPAPGITAIAEYGSSFRYHYQAKHSIDETTSTVEDADWPLLLLRAQAEAMRELAMRSVNKPVSVRDGVNGSPRNSTPASLYKEMMAEFDKS